MKASPDPQSAGMHRVFHFRLVRLLIVMALASLLGLAVAAPGLARIVGEPKAPASPAIAAPIWPTIPKGNALAHLPLRFVANQGQWETSVRFAAPGAGHTLYFTPRQVIFSVAGEEDTATYVRLTFPGAQAHPQVEGAAPLPGSVNSFLGNDPGRWRVNIPSCAAVVYRNLYPGVDLIYSGAYGQLKSEFRLAPGVHPRRIQLAYWGAEAAEVMPDGALRLRTAVGELVEAAPWAYQEVGGRHQAVMARYVVLLAPPRTPFPVVQLPALVRFEVSGYDPRWPLVIDPVLRYASYLGGGGDESGNGIAVDGAGNIYVAGRTGSNDFPTRVAIQAQNRGGSDVFVTQLLRVDDVYTYGFSTYLGGGASDIAYGIAVSGSGDAVTIVGETNSGNFPTFNAPQATKGVSVDAFVTRFVTQSGVITFAYSTYLGGSGDDVGYGLALDGNDAPVIVGQTFSGNFPTRYALQGSLRGATDAFVSQLISTTGVYTLGLSTYLGGRGTEAAYGVAVDAAGDIYATGQTYSGDFPTVQALDASRSGTTDAFVARIGWGGLMISKTATPTVVAPGRMVTYTLIFTNDSPTLAQNVVISDYLPIPATFSDASYVSSGAAVTPTGSFSYTWQVADLAQGGGGTIQVLAVLSDALTPGTLITNTAAITGDGVYTSVYNTSTAVITVGYGVYLPIISKQP